MATYSSTLAWKLPWTGEPGGLPSMGSHRVGHDLAAAAGANYYIQNGQTRSYCIAQGTIFDILA